jgi:hypothetical protein
VDVVPINKLGDRCRRYNYLMMSLKDKSQDALFDDMI